MKRTRESLQIDFSRVVSAAEVALEALQLPIIFENRNGLVGAPELRLTEEIKEVHIRTDAVADMTAEAAASLMALQAWLEKRVSSAKLVCDLTSTLQRIEKSVADKGSAYFFCKSIRVPSIPTLGRPSQEQIRSIEKTVRAEARHLFQTIPHPLTDNEKGWIFELVLESLLNIAEHANPSKVEPGLEAEAFIAFRLTNQFGSDHSEYGRPRPHLRASFDYEWPPDVNRHSSAVLEAAVCDIGQGIPQSLSRAYLTVQGERGNPTHHPSRTQLHNDVLAWAISPFGTRKSSSDFISDLHVNSWRGLYRIAFKTQRLSGGFGVSSGCGRFEFSTGRELRTLRTLGNGDRGIPWTSVGAAIRLGGEGFPRVSAAAGAGAEATTVDVDAANMVVVSPTEKIEFLDSLSIDKYREAVYRAVSTKISLQNTSQHEGIQYVAIVHPSIPYSQPRAFEPAHLLGVHSPATPIPQVIWRILQPLMVPGVAFLHFFLDEAVSASAIQEAQEYIYTKSEDLTPFEQYSSFGLHAIYRAREDCLTWFFSVRPSEGSRNPASVAAKDASRNAKIWSRYASAVGIGNGLKQLPMRVSPSTLRAAVGALLPALSARSHNHGTDATRNWYWRAERDSNGVPKAGIQVSGDRVAFEYLNTCTLCETVSAVFFALRNDFFQWLGDLQRKKGKSLLIVPDNEVLSRFLLNRLEQEWREARGGKGVTGKSTLRVRFCNLDDVALLLQSDDHLLVFADFALSGESLARRIQLLEKVPGVTSQHNVSAYIFVRGGPLTKAFGQLPETENFVYFPIHYRPKKEPEPAALLSIDPISNDLLPARQTEELSQFVRLSWHEPSASSTDLCSDERFEYGIRFVSGRYFICRWPVTKNLAKPGTVSIVAESIVSSIRSLASTNLESVVILAREDSTLRTHLGSIAAEVCAYFGTKAKMPIDASDVSIGVVADRQYESRRLSTHSIFSAIVDSAPLSGTAELFEGESPLIEIRSSNQLTLEGFEVGQSRPKVLRPSRKIGVIFLDNAAVTGRTIYELMHALSQLQRDGSIELSGLRVHCVVTRLSPIDESVLRQISLNLTHAGRKTPVPVSFHFEALIQLRIRSYRNLDSLRAVQTIKRAISSSRLDSEPGISKVRSKLLQAMSDLGEVGASSRSSRAVTSFFGNISRNSRADSCGRGVVELRQLLSLKQQGVPCTQTVIECFRELIRLDPVGVVMIFGLEPDLLEEDVLRSRLAFDLEALCLSLLSDTSETAVMETSLWVLANLRQATDLGLDRVLRLNSSVDEILPVFVFLTLYVLEEPRRSLVATQSYRLLLGREGKLTQAEIAALTSLKGSLILQDASHGDKGAEHARYNVEHYLIAARSRHGTRGHAAWIRIREWHLASLRAIGPGLPGTAMPESLNPAIIEEAEQWLKEAILPAIHAVCVLVERSDRELRRVADMRTGAAELGRLFAQFRFLMSRRHETGLSDSDEIRIWTAIEERTSHYSTDALFGNPENFRYLNLGLTRNRSSGRLFTHFDALLAKTAAESLYVILGRIAYVLQPSCPISWLHFDSTGREQRAKVTLVSDLRSDSLLTHFWFVRRTLFLFSAEAIPAIDEAIDIVLNNFIAYGQTSRGMSLVTRESVTDSHAAFDVEFENYVAKDRGKGSGHGLQNVRECVRAIGGDSEHKNDGRVHKVTMRIPVNTLNIPESER